MQSDRQHKKQEKENKFMVKYTFPLNFYIPLSCG